MNYLFANLVVAWLEALVVILFDRAVYLPFGEISLESFMKDYFEFGPAIKKEMLFKDFAIFSSGGHLI